MIMKNTDCILRNEWLTLLMRIVIGILFIYAAFDKLQFPREFVSDVGRYMILPSSLINMTAIFLPAIEFVIGLSLLIGLFPRGAAFIMIALMIIFIGAFILTIILGVEVFNCGCFPIDEQTKTSPLLLILRDLVFLLIALQVFFGKHRFALQNLITKA